MKVMKVSFVIGILFAGALSMGCVAQAGTDDSSQSEGLTADQAPVVQKQAAPSMKQRVQLAPQTLQQQHVVVPTNNGFPQTELEGLAPVDPGDSVQDDGDGKEPDPHPWHTNTATLASH